MNIFLKILGYLCYLFGVIDFAGMFFQYDLTGVAWSPIIAGLLGSVLIYLGNKENDNNETE